MTSTTTIRDDSSAHPVRCTRNAALRYRQVVGFFPHHAKGCVQVYAGRGRNRQHLTGLYDGAKSGMDTFDGQQPYSTVCEIHSHIISHETLTLARQWLAHPDEWCDGCMDRAAS